MSNNIKLPPLPELPAYPAEVFDREVKVISETMVEQLMQDYARAAIEADRQRRGEPVARVNDDGFIVETGLGLAPGTLLYTAPQPAEPVVKDSLTVAEPVKVPSDDEVLEAMRPSLDEGDGGYVCDMSPMHVIASGRALLARYGSKS